MMGQSTTGPANAALMRTMERESFFGTLHGQGRHAVEFFTQTKVVVERWTQGEAVRWV